MFSQGLGHNNVVDRFWAPWGRQAAPGPSNEVWAGKKMETISTTSRSKASETDTPSDKNEALRMSEGLRSPVGTRSPNRELRDDFLDVILLPNGDPVGVHFWPRDNFDRFFSDFGTERKRGEKTLISRTFQKRESRGRYSVYSRISTIFCTH